MKYLYKNYYDFGIITAILLTCWNGSMVDSEAKDKRLDVNFYGVLTSHNNSSVKVEDIAIRGKYNGIAFYSIPQEKNQTLPSTGSATAMASMPTQPKELDPKKDKVLLNLHDIASIELAFPDKPTEHELTINGNKYTQVIITLTNDTHQNYLVESSCDISCLQVNQGADKNTKPVLEKRKLNISHIKKLVIKGKKGAQDINQSRITEEMQSNDKVEIAKNTEEILDQIQNQVDTLSQDQAMQNSSHFQQFKSSVVSLLRSLRDQLQKMLSMIKS